MQFKKSERILLSATSVAIITSLLFIIDQITGQVSLATTPISSLSPTTAPSNFVNYENSSFGLKFQSPSSWSKVEISSPRLIDIKFISLSNTSDKFPTTIDIAIEKNLGNITSLDQYAHVADETLNTSFSSFNMSTSGSTFLAGFPAIERVFDYKLTIPEVLLKARQIFTIHNNMAYVITYTSEATRYSNYLPIFGKIVDSFQITK
jgi:serine/threonine-protein kinase